MIAIKSNDLIRISSKKSKAVSEQGSLRTSATLLGYRLHKEIIWKIILFPKDCLDIL